MKPILITILFCFCQLMLVAQNYEHRGDSLFTCKQYEKAIKQYKAAIEIYGDNPKLTAKLSKAQNKYEQSLHKYLVLDMTGTIGTSQGTLMYNEQDEKGYYTYLLPNATIKRNIVLDKYNNGRLLLKSYDLSGKYIGLFNGDLTQNGNKMQYSGIFTNYKGVSVNFKLKQR
ncbi:MAG: tetratricopeptide repeat protein [Paludibacteraceae bacterium]|nr:tetratricopeptide repeat protein [Paludibacteraceae bacterium]